MKSTPKIVHAVVVATVIYLAITSPAPAISPPPDGGYPNFNTAEGTLSLFSLTTGSGNTAVGGRALQSNTITSDNTAVGYGTLFSNRASLNTAVGFDALFSNVSGGFNTATGERALYNNTSGAYNTAEGAVALFSNTGSYNTASGTGALFSNTGPAAGCDSCGSRNTGIGVAALFANQSGYSNTALGTNALFVNTTASNNTALGDGAMGSGSNASYNTAVGAGALFNGIGPGVGSYNTAIGFQAGYRNDFFGGPGDYNIEVGAFAGTLDFFSANWNINIGNAGSRGLSNITRIGTAFDPVSGSGQTSVFIAGIAGTTLDNGVPVVVDTSTGQLGVLPSSQRFKADIKPMDKASETILGLRPVSFCYQSSTAGTPQFGLIAEEVAKINPDLVVRDSDGKPYTVRYDAVNAMLLNEFLKEHRKVQDQATKVQKQEATITDLKSAVAQHQQRFAREEAQIQALTASLQKVSAQLEVIKPPPQMVAARQNR